MTTDVEIFEVVGLSVNTLTLKDEDGGTYTFKSIQAQHKLT